MPSNRQRTDVASLLDGHLELLEQITNAPQLTAREPETACETDAIRADPRVQRVVSLVAREFSLSSEAVLAGYGGHYMSRMRSVLVYLLRNELNIDIHSVGRITGHASTSCYQMAHRIGRKRKKNAQLNRLLTKLETEIRGGAIEIKNPETHPLAVASDQDTSTPTPKPIEISETPIAAQSPTPPSAPVPQHKLTGGYRQRIEDGLAKLEAEQTAERIRAERLKYELADAEMSLAERDKTITRLRGLLNDANELDDEITRLIGKEEG